MMPVAGSGDVDFYRFDLLDGERFSLDIDGTTGGLNSTLSLFDINGTLLAFNDNASTSVGAGGSSSGFDSFLTYDIDTAGTYFVAVASAGGASSGSYTLNAVIDPQPADSIVLVFDDSNWNVAQNVTIFAVNDSGVEGPTIGVINHSIIATDTISGAVTSAAVSNGLTTITTGNVSGIPSGDLIGATINITGGTGVGQSSIIVGNDATSLSLGRALATALDATSTFEIIRYDAMAISSVFVNVIDNDAAGVVITESLGSTNVIEGGTTDSFDVTLTKAPTSNVAVSFSGDGQITANGSGTTVLNFNSSNWNVAQSVTVAAIDDAAVEGFQVSAITATVASSDGSFNGIAVDSVRVDVADNDAPGVLITQTDGSTDTIEGARTDTYSVVLTMAPSEDVVVDVTPLETRASRGPIFSFGQQVTVDQSALTFTTANWFTPQIVTVTAIDDNFVDGGDTKTFAPILDVVTGVRGPLVIDGFSSGSSAVSLGGAAVFLPGETNVADSDGLIRDVTATTVTVLTSALAGVDLNAANLGVQITQGQAVNEFRLIDFFTDDVNAGTTTFTLLTAWDVNKTPLAFDQNNLSSNSSSFAITAINANFFVDESTLLFGAEHPGKTHTDKPATIPVEIFAHGWLLIKPFSPITASKPKRPANRMTTAIGRIQMPRPSQINIVDSRSCRKCS
ncbi:MAG: pre-peptidase C-terminal domain-containing protein, partial [Chloroflexi bacterium]|nr:pre-peptidase C-terminal domain-containing protein [Chloroflexota bacterium]